MPQLSHAFQQRRVPEKELVEFFIGESFAVELLDGNLMTFHAIMINLTQ